MVVPPPVRPPTITKFLKPYVLKMHFTNKYVSAQVVHSPTANVASSASSQEKALRESLESHRDVAAAAKIGKILGEHLLLKNIPAVSVHLKREQKYHEEKAIHEMKLNSSKHVEFSQGPQLDVIDPVPVPVPVPEEVTALTLCCDSSRKFGLDDHCE